MALVRESHVFDRTAFMFHPTSEAAAPYPGRWKATRRERVSEGSATQFSTWRYTAHAGDGSTISEWDTSDGKIPVHAVESRLTRVPDVVLVRMYDAMGACRVELTATLVDKGGGRHRGKKHRARADAGRRR